MVWVGAGCGCGLDRVWIGLDPGLSKKLLKNNLGKLLIFVYLQIVVQNSQAGSAWILLCGGKGHDWTLEGHQVQSLRSRVTWDWGISDGFQISRTSKYF